MASVMELKPRAISLFSGMGGDTLGMEQAGFECVAFSEIEPSCVAVHLDNFPGAKHLTSEGSSVPLKQKGNIQLIPDSVFDEYRGNVDLVFAGFPCQGFSHAGKKEDNDPRNRLFYEFLRVVNDVKPRWMIGENVPGLLTKKTDGGDMRVIEKIRDEFASIGYRIYYSVLDATYYGVPQSRKRLIIVGFRDDGDADAWVSRGGFRVPPKPSVTPRIRDILQMSLQRAIPIPATNTRITKKDTISVSSEEMDCLLEGMDETLECHPYVRVKVDDGEISYGKRESPTHSEILNADAPCKTLISTYCRMPRLFVSIGDGSRRWIRTLLPDEGKQIQGFPRDFKLDCARNLQAQWTMIGNAVPPPVISGVVKTLLD
jgi:DNA (cytosine-5)-methyltransferase 1